jgi:hypothetical protein
MEELRHNGRNYKNIETMGFFRNFISLINHDKLSLQTNNTEMMKFIFSNSLPKIAYTLRLQGGKSVFIFFSWLTTIFVDTGCTCAFKQCIAVHFAHRAQLNAHVRFLETKMAVSHENDEYAVNGINTGKNSI